MYTIVFSLLDFCAGRANVCPEYSALLKATTTPLTSNNKNKATSTHFQHSLDTSALLQSSQGQILFFLLLTMGTFPQNLLNDTSVKVDFCIYPFSSEGQQGAPHAKVKLCWIVFFYENRYIRVT